MKIGALYIRVSTDKQEELSPDAQLRLGIDFAKKNEIVIPKEYIFMENGISGRKADKRPKFQRLISIAKSKDHPIDVILVWRFSRFARNQEESIVYKSLLHKNDVEVISISEPIIDGPFGSLIERIIEWSDEYYSIQLGEDVTRGMTEKALRGGYQTGAPFGYIMKDGNLIQDEVAATLVKTIYELYLYEAENFFSIAQRLNEMGIKTKRGNLFENRGIKYILQNPVYKGYVRWNPNGKEDFRDQKNFPSELIIEKSDHEPIISEELWEKVNEKILTEYKPRYAKPNNLLSHWLGGVLRCSTCGNVLVSGGASGGFQCSWYAKGKCKISHYVSHKKIENAVLDAIKELSHTGDFDYEIVSTDTAKDDTEMIKTSLKKLDQKEQRIKDAYINEVDTLEEYKSNKEKLNDERMKLQKQLSEISLPKKTIKSKTDMLNKLSNVYSVLVSSADVSIKNTSLKSIVKKITYDKKTESINVYLYYS